jgi:hypothetical protein
MRYAEAVAGSTALAAAKSTPVVMGDNGEDVGHVEPGVTIRSPSVAMGGRFEFKDSGERQQFDTGAVRDAQEGKGRYDLLQVLALRRVAVVLERGAVKYDARNWEKGMPLSRFVDSALRHLMQYVEGRRDEDHAAHAAWNLLSLVQTEEMIQRGLLPAELDDLPSYIAAPGD